jgi:hypothetical protein
MRGEHRLNLPGDREYQRVHHILPVYGYQVKRCVVKGNVKTISVRAVGPPEKPARLAGKPLTGFP